MFDEEIERIQQELINAGALIPAGQDEDGEDMFTFDLEVLKVVHPELYKAHMTEVQQALLDLSDDGLVSLEYDVEANDFLVYITEEGQRVLQERFQ